MVSILISTRPVSTPCINTSLSPGFNQWPGPISSTLHITLLVQVLRSLPKAHVLFCCLHFSSYSVMLRPSLHPQCLRFPCHPPCLHPVKLLALFSLGSKSGMFFPFLPSLLSSHFKWYLLRRGSVASHGSPPALCLPPCGPIGLWGVRPPGPQHLAVCPARKRCSLGNICWFCWRNKKGFSFYPQGCEHHGS